MGAPPSGKPPSTEILTAMGDDGVFALLSAFYAELEASEIRGLFPDDMQAASRKSAAFFVQLLGGQPLYSQRYGQPRMRQLHEPFEIDESARAVWLETFEGVLARSGPELGFPEAHLPEFCAFLQSFSAWMVNTK